MIAIIDYGMGNVKSLSNAVDYLGYEALITDNRDIINSATHLLLPGVGAFGDAMNKLKEKDLDAFLGQQVIEKGKPFLGICLGMQLLSNRSFEHGSHKGLGWIDSEVIKFQFTDNKLKIPHMGWNDINIHVETPLFFNLTTNNSFYFVHSFYMDCKDCKDIAASCHHGFDFTAAVKKENILGTQFHPEKSQDNGIQVLKNFLQWNP